MNYIGYEAIATATVVLLAACAALAVIWGAVKAVHEMRKPTVDLHEMVEEHERKLLHDHERLEDLKEASDLQMEMLLQLANHAIDGDHTAQMVEVRDRMQKYLIKR